LFHEYIAPLIPNELHNTVHGRFKMTISFRVKALDCDRSRFPMAITLCDSFVRQSPLAEPLISSGWVGRKSEPGLWLGREIN
jgi:hypothetical protein